MPAKYTITVPDHLKDRLASVVQRHNENAGTELTVAQWLELHVAEVAIADDFAAEVQQLQEQQKQELQAAARAIHDRLIAGEGPGDGEEVPS